VKIEEEIQQKKFRTESQKVIVNIMFTGNWLSGHISTILKPHGISPEQYNVLRILRGQHPNPASVRTITERMLDKMSNASRLVEKLRKKGLVNRQPCPGDRRQVDIRITEKGLSLLATLDQEMDQLDHSLINLEEGDAYRLNELLDKLRT
jgi:DNA-binding MarR family transcriptional regulator